MSTSWHIRGTNWLALLPAADAETVRRGSSATVYDRGQTIFGPSPQPRHVYILEGGVVRLLQVSEDGREVTLGYVRPGELFGEVVVMTERPRDSFAEARTRARVLRVPGPLFLDTLRRQPALLLEVTRQIGDRLLRYQSRIEDLVFRDVRARLALLLVRLHDEHESGDPSIGSIALPFTQDEIARLIGASRQTVSAAVKELTDAGLVKRIGRALVAADKTALRALAGVAPAEAEQNAG